MRIFKCSPIHYSITIFILLIIVTFLFAGASDPPNFIPSMTIRYEDPQTKKQQIYKIDSYAAAKKTYQIPSGVEMTLVFEAMNVGDNYSGDGISVDAWLDWTDQELPPEESDADFLCVPQTATDCFYSEQKIKADADFKGSGGKGVYNVLIWVDRFNTQGETSDEDNILGPVKIVAIPVLHIQQPSEVKPKPPVLITPGKVKKISQ